MNLGCIKPLCDLLTVMDSKIVQVALNGLENILRLGEQEAKQETSGAGVNPYCSLIEEAYGQHTHTAGPHTLLVTTHALLVHTLRVTTYTLLVLSVSVSVCPCLCLSGCLCLSLSLRVSVSGCLCRCLSTHT